MRETDIMSGQVWHRKNEQSEPLGEGLPLSLNERKRKVRVQAENTKQGSHRQKRGGGDQQA